MKINVRRYDNKYSFATVTIDNTEIDLGCLDVNERESLANQLREAADDLFLLEADQ